MSAIVSDSQPESKDQDQQALLSTPAHIEAPGADIDGIVESTRENDLLENIFGDFDSRHKEELRTKEATLKLRSADFAEKAKAISQMQSRLKTEINYDAQKAFDLIDELATFIEQICIVTDQKMPADLRKRLEAAMKVREGIEDRVKAIAKSDEHAEEIRKEILGREATQKLLVLTFESLKEFGLETSGVAAEEAKKQSETAFKESEEYTQLLQKFPTLSVRYETAENDLETAKRTFMQRLRNKLQDRLDRNHQLHPQVELILRRCSEVLEESLKDLPKEEAIKILEMHMSGEEQDILNIIEAYASLLKYSIHRVGNEDHAFEKEIINTAFLSSLIADNLMADLQSIVDKRYSNIGKTIKAYIPLDQLPKYGLDQKPITTPEGLQYRPDHRDHDLQRIKENRRLLQQFAEDTSTPLAPGVTESTPEKKVFYSTEAAVEELEKLRVETLRLLQEHTPDKVKLAKITEVIDQTLAKLSESPEDLRNTPAMRQLETVFKNLKSLL